MKLAILFLNLGGYHAARIRAAAEALPGDEVCVVQYAGATAEHPWGDFVRMAGVEVRTLAESDRGAGAGHVSRVLDALAPDVVAIPGWGDPEGRAALRWCVRRRRPAILMSESKRDDAPRVRWKEWLKRRMWGGRFGAALVGGRRHADYARTLGIPPERIFTGYDVVDNEHFVRGADSVRRGSREIPGRLRTFLDGAPCFLVATRFIDRKNVPRLVRAFARARGCASVPWKLVICGDGEDRPRIEREVERAGAGAVLLAGYVPYDEMPAWYGAASAFLHPPLVEQWGLVVNEAMAAALPVAVSRAAGCFDELVGGTGAGWGFDPCDEDEMAAVLTEVQAMPVEALEAMGHAGRRRVREHFSPAVFGEGMRHAVEAVRGMGRRDM